MAIQFVCDCGKRISVGEDMVGKRVRCPACQHVVTVPTDDDGDERDDRARGRPGKSKKKSSAMLYIGLGAGVLLLSCCCLGGVGVGLFFLMAQNDKVLAGTFPLEEKGTWSSTDRHTTVSQGLLVSINVPYKGYKVPLKANRTYVIDLIRNDSNSDPYLVLQDPDGKTVATNDDWGKGLDARIVYTPPKDGEYRILAATIADMGSFTLKIESREPPPPGGDKGKNPGIDNKGKGSSRMILDQKGTWTQQDPLYPARNSRYKSYTVNLQAGKIYTIDLKSANGGLDGVQDPYLYLTDAAGTILAQDDDGGGGLDARIIYAPAKGGQYQIIATSLNNCLGNFTLTVREDSK
jgi:hypothetical protein